MAEIYKRPNSPYYYAIFWTPWGERVRRSTRCRDKSQAARHAREWERELEKKAADAAAGIKEPSSVSLLDLAAEFIADRTAKKKATSYVETMERHLKVRILPYFRADTIAAEVTEKDVRAFQRALLDGTAPRNASPKQRRENGKLGVANTNRHIVTLRCMFKFGVQEEYLVLNPAQNVKAIKKKPDPRHRALDDNELGALRAELPAECVFWVDWMCETGCRDNEAAQVLWSDVNLERRELRIRATTAKDADNRTLPLTKAAIAVLDAIELDEKKRKELIFGKRDRRDTLRSAWERTGLPGRAPSAHDFRHYAEFRIMPNCQPEASCATADLGLHSA